MMNFAGRGTSTTRPPRRRRQFLSVIVFLVSLLSLVVSQYLLSLFFAQQYEQEQQPRKEPVSLASSVDQSSPNRNSSTVPIMATTTGDAALDTTSTNTTRTTFNLRSGKEDERMENTSTKGSSTRKQQESVVVHQHQNLQHHQQPPTTTTTTSTSTSHSPVIQCYNELQQQTRSIIQNQMELHLPILISVRYTTTNQDTSSTTNSSTIQLIFVLKNIPLNNIVQYTQGPWYCIGSGSTTTDGTNNRILAKLWIPDPSRYSLIMECPTQTNGTTATTSTSYTTTTLPIHHVQYKNSTTMYYSIEKFLQCESLSFFRSSTTTTPTKPTSTPIKVVKSTKGNINNQLNHGSSSSNSNNNAQIVMCTMIQGMNDLALLPQWIEYHRIIGFQQFWIYINDDWNHIISQHQQSSSLSSSSSLYFHHYIHHPQVQQYITLIPFNWYRNETIHGFLYQQVMQNDCLTLGRRMNITWIALLDVDEYIQLMNISMNTNISTFLQPYEQQNIHLGGISLRNWFFFRGNNNDRNNNNTISLPQPRPAQERFYQHLLMKDYTYRAPDATFFHRTKVIARPKNVLHFSVHAITKGGPRIHIDPYQQIRLNHYQKPHLGVRIDPLDANMYLSPPSSSISSNKANTSSTTTNNRIQPQGILDTSFHDQYGHQLQERLHELFAPFHNHHNIKPISGYTLHPNSIKEGSSNSSLSSSQQSQKDLIGAFTPTIDWGHDNSRKYVRSFSESSLNHRVLTFLHIPKTAGTTVEELIGAPGNISWGIKRFVDRTIVPFRYAGRCSPHHVPLYYWPLQGINPYEHADVFTIVRHPLKRMISEYHWRLNTFPFLRDSRDMTTLMRVQFRLFDQKSSLLQARCHLHPQSSFVFGFHQVRMVDYILDLDHFIKQEFNQLAMAYELNVTWPDHNRSMVGTYQTKPLDLIPPDFVNLVVQRFTHDFGLLRDKEEIKRWVNASIV